MVVTLHSYRKESPFLFEKEKLRITTVLNNIDIHHVGSSAVLDLNGKNIIDILIGLDNFLQDVKGISSKLSKLGYVLKFIDKEKEWAYLSKFTDSSKCEYHVHLVWKNSKNYEDWFLFRNYLRKHKEERDNYAKLKEKWLMKSKRVAKVYAGLKTEYVQSVLDKARKEQS